LADKPKFNIRGTSRWGRVQLFQAPYDLVNDSGLVLKPRALAVFLSLLRVANATARRTHEARAITVKMTMGSICLNTGLGRTQATQGIKEAIEHGYLSKEKTTKKYKEYGSNEYQICHHEVPLLTERGRSLYFSNLIQYMTIPADFVRQRAAWALCNLSGSEIALYFGLLWLSSVNRTNEFVVDDRLQQICRLSRRTFQKTLESPRLSYLFSIQGQSGELGRLGNALPGGKPLNVALLDPCTGEKTHPMTNDPHDAANYVVLDDHGIGRRLNFNAYTPDQIEALLISCNLNYRQKGDDFVMNCVFHPENDPSLSVHNRHMGFHCFGCGAHGNIKKLVGHVLGLNGQQTIMHIAKVTGIPPERLQFREFKSKAEAVYAYHDEQGRIVKEKLRFSGKTFQWRVYIYRERPLLYNAHLLQFALTVVVVEGEKDADAITNLHLRDEWGTEIIGTTSGSATSWTDGHVKALRDKRVIVLPDHDAAGQDYANQVLTSCIKNDIEWRLISFGQDDLKGMSGYDVSDFLDKNTPEQLVEKIGPDWFHDVKPEPEYIEA